MQRPTALDRVRQVTVTAAEVFCIVGTLVGVGVLGTEVASVSDGALAADATLVAPAGPAFSIWSVVYAGLAAYTVWQWLPSRAAHERHRRIGWLAAASMVLNATWLLVTQQGWIWASVVVILALVATLVELVRRLTRLPADGVLERVLVDGTFGLYLGWVAVAVCANLAAAAAGSGLDPTGAGGYALAIAVLVAVTAAGVALALRAGGRVAVAGASAWGLSWIAYGRLADSPDAPLVAVAAVLAALVLVGAVVVARVRGAGSGGAVAA